MSAAPHVAVSAQLSGTLSTLNMLTERVHTVRDTVVRMAAGEVPFDADVARGAAALAARLPALEDLAALRQEAAGEADVLMAVLAAAVTKGSGTGTPRARRVLRAHAGDPTAAPSQVWLRMPAWSPVCWAPTAPKPIPCLPSSCTQPRG